MELNSLKIKAFFREKRDYFLVFGIFFCLFNIVLLASGAWPYGKNLIFVSDSYQQITYLFEYIFKVIKGEASLFYTNALGGGLTILSTLEYMFLNPFYLIALMFGEAHYEIGLIFSLFAMLLFNMFIFLWFARKHFKDLNSFVKILFALCFGFSGFIVQNTSFITWLTFPGLTLLLIDQFLKLVKTGKIAGFVGQTIWYVLSCYSSGISTMVILLVLFSAYIIFTKDKQERKPIFLRLFVAYIISAAVCLVVLFPSIIDLFSSGRSTSIFYNLIIIKNSSLSRKISVLFADGIIMWFAIIYLFKCDKKDKLNKFYIFAFIFLLLPTLFDSIQKLLCGSLYVSFVSRFYFLTDVLIFILSCKFITEKKVVLKDEKTSKPAASFFGMVVGFLLTFVLVYLIIFADNIGSYFKSQGVVKGDTLLIITFSIFCLVSLIALAAWLLNKRGLFGKRAVKVGVSVSLIFALIFNFICFLGGSSQDDSLRKNAYQLAETNNITTGIKYFQGEISGKSYNYLTSGLNISAFTSMLSQNAIDTYVGLGFYASDVKISGETGCLISDSLAGLEYYVSEQELNRPYLTFVDIVDGLYLYKNELSTTGAVVLSEEILTEADSTYKDNFVSLQEYFGISGTLFEDVTLEKFDKMEEADDGVYKFTYTANRTGILYVSSIVTYIKDHEYDSNYTLINCSGNANFCSDIAFLNEGESYTFYVSGGESPDEFSYFFMDYEVASEILTNLKNSEVEISYSKTGYSIEFSAKEDGFLYVFKPLVSGMKYYISSEEINPEIGFSNALSFAVGSGQWELSAEYNYPHLKLWLIVSLLMIILVVFFALMFKFNKLSWLQGVMPVVFYVLNCIILVVCYVFGFLLSIIGFFL